MPNPIQSLSAERLCEWMDEDDKPLLINVLPRVSFDKQHIPDSEHVSQYGEDFCEEVRALASGSAQRLVVYCNSKSCNASARAALKLVNAGFTNVFDFEGGVHEWREAGYTIQGSAARPR